MQNNLNRGKRKSWILFALAWSVALVGLVFSADRIGRNSAISQLLESAETDGALKTAMLNIAFERPRALPLVLSADPDVAAALSDEPGAAQRLNEKLEKLSPETEASVIYVTRNDGQAISSSNWREKTSFVGVNFAFREYFKIAMLSGRAEHYALGHVSNAPGLYIAKRVDDSNGAALGIVIAKVEFPQLEADWSIGGRPVYVTDQNGVVLMTSIAEWRFKTSWPLTAETQRAIAELRQFGDVKLEPLDIDLKAQMGPAVSIVNAAVNGETTRSYFRYALPVPSTGWTLHYLQPMQDVVAMNVRQMLLLLAACIMPLIALSAYLLHRRFRIEEDRILAEQDRAQLEVRVQERTAALTKARDTLETEIYSHRQTETALRQVQHQLVQANRLSILGQVAAGVAHEINQPVATIRAFADNARKFLERGRPADAEQNLIQIASLTERIGTITSDLKTLARKGRKGQEPVNLRSVIDGAVVLLRSRFAGHLDALHIEYPPDDLMVMGSQIRLEQIVINLLQNALEAVSERLNAHVAIVTKQLDGEIALVISDNGPGISPDIHAQLFSPFNTSKEGGLGLGLVISSDIAADYGGRIDVETTEHGTSFTLILKKAEH